MSIHAVPIKLNEKCLYNVIALGFDQRYWICEFFNEAECSSGELSSSRELQVPSNVIDRCFTNGTKNNIESLLTKQQDKWSDTIAS